MQVIVDLAYLTDSPTESSNYIAVQPCESAVFSSSCICVIEQEMVDPCSLSLVSGSAKFRLQFGDLRPIYLVDGVN